MSLGKLDQAGAPLGHTLAQESKFSLSSPDSAPDSAPTRHHPRPRPSRLSKGSWPLRSLQSTGLVAAILAMLSAAFLIGGLEPQAPAYAASAAGLGLLGISLPLLGLAAVLLLPSSALLCLPSLRARWGFRGAWFALWCLNTGLSLTLMAACAWLTWVWMTHPLR